MCDLSLTLSALTGFYDPLTPLDPLSPLSLVARGEGDSGRGFAAGGFAARRKTLFPPPLARRHRRSV